MLRKTEPIKRAVLRVDGFCDGSSALLASSLRVPSLDTSAAFVAGPLNASSVSELVLGGVDGREDAMMFVESDVLP